MDTPSPTQTPPTLVARLHLIGLKAGIAYCAVSIATIPFAGAIWIGELPLLAVIQLPKITVAGWLRQHVVMEAIKSLGFSKGSFSPDYIMARPFGLGLAYSIPIIIVSLSLLIPACSSWRHRRLALVFFACLMVDCLFTYLFANRRSLSLY
jgi:hypothetical protein